MSNRSGFRSFDAKSWASALSRLSKCERATVAIEYGLIAGLISIAIVASLITIGDTLRDDWYQAIADAVAAAAG